MRHASFLAIVSLPASSAAACAGARRAPTTSSPCAPASKADCTTTTGAIGASHLGLPLSDRRTKTSHTRVTTTAGQLCFGGATRAVINPVVIR